MDVAYSEEELAEKEIHYIKKYNSFFKDKDFGSRYGYNMTIGGEGVSGYSRKWSEEEKEKIRGKGNHQFGKHLTNEQKETIRKAHLGIKHTEESKQKLRKFLLENHPNKKTIDYILIVNLFFKGLSYTNIMKEYCEIKKVNYSNTPFKNALKKLGLCLGATNQNQYKRLQKEFIKKNKMEDYIIKAEILNKK